MSEPIKPALTGEEWAQAAKSRKHSDMALLGYRGSIGIGRDHATAALALWSQPFGFTREDVNHLRETAITLVKVGELLKTEFEMMPTSRIMRSLADRIEALLPPEKE